MLTDTLYIVKIADRQYSSDWSKWEIPSTDFYYNKLLWVASNSTTFSIIKAAEIADLQLLINEIMLHGSVPTWVHGIIILTKPISPGFNINIEHMTIV